VLFLFFRRSSSSISDERVFNVVLESLHEIQVENAVEPVGRGEKHARALERFSRVAPLVPVPMRKRE